MMKNAYTGQSEIELGGVKYPLAFTWAAIAELRTIYGKGFDKEVISAISELDTAKLADVVSIGIGGKLSPQEIKDLSPPLVSVANVINEALNAAFYGVDEVKKKQTGQSQKATLLQRLFRLRQGQE